MTDFPTDYRAPEATITVGRGRRRSILPTLLRRLKAFFDWVDGCWAVDVLGAATILIFMLLTPVFLPLIFEVFHAN